MERIPGERAMNICFSISSRPTSPCGPKLFSEVEGGLSILIDGKIVFNEVGILLLELAQCMNHWLSAIKEGRLGDFIYESMDYEDGPVLEFNRRNGGWNISSVWMEERRPKCFVLHEDLVKAVGDFISEIRREFGEACVDELF